MRILSGQYKGQSLLQFPKTLPIRPMTQRVKKSVFDVIRPYFQQNSKIKVLDLFSGSGQLSFESLSQGAFHCCAVEQNRQCCQLIRKNAQKLNIKTGWTLHQENVFRFLKKHQDIESFDIIFADPPFKKQYGESIVQCLSLSPLCNQDSLVVLEASEQENALKDAAVSLQSQKSFGDKQVYFFKIIK